MIAAVFGTLLLIFFALSPLPAGCPAMVVLALVPSLWFLVMDRRIPQTA